MFFHVFTHIKANHTISRTKKFDSQLFGKFCLTDTSWPNEEEASDWAVRGTKSDTITANSLGNLIDCIILANNMRLEIFG
ncbi:Uncharacterised protein [Streptococcus pneumoniae]|nr:Uncharacterised protein [Streptococcus pneumoniae]